MLSEGGEKKGNVSYRNMIKIYKKIYPKGVPDSTPVTIDHSYILPFPRWSSVHGEKKRISIFPWHSTSTSAGIHYRCHCYVREPALFLSGRMRWEIKVTTSLARAPARLFSLI